MIDIFDFISGICSIVGLVVSLLAMNKVTTFEKSFNNSTISVQTGNGKQTVVGDKAIVVQEGSVVNYTDNRTGEFDEVPKLTKKDYPIFVNNFVRYSLNIAEDTCFMTKSTESNDFGFNADFKNTISMPETTRWIGYSIKSLPMNDWRSFVEQGYQLNFSWKSIGSLKRMWIELTNCQANIKLCNKEIELTQDKGTFSLDLKQFQTVIDKWKSVDEICFVFFPQENVGTYGMVNISQLQIHSN